MSSGVLGDNTQAIERFAAQAEKLTPKKSLKTKK